jgi:hypothetical protein
MLLSTACGGSSHASGARANRTPRQQALAYTQCLRSHGAPHHPGPNGSGVFIMTPQNAADFHSTPASALQACLHLSWRLPREGKPELNPVLQAQVNRANLAFARCVRRHGIAKFPDSWDSGGNIGRMKRLGIDTDSPQFSAALKACGF